MVVQALIIHLLYILYSLNSLEHESYQYCPDVAHYGCAYDAWLEEQCLKFYFRAKRANFG